MRPDRMDEYKQMMVDVGESARFFGADPKPTHLVVEVADRQALACTAGAASAVREVPFDETLDTLICGDCRRRWNKIMKLRRTANPEV
jgi:hypothetical protein